MQFSIVIPAKNEERNLGRCLDSLLQVEWDPREFEIMVVDNGSSDRTPQIAREKGVQVFVKPALTIAGLRNFGAREASGEIVAFIDADCTVERNWLAEAARYLEEPGVACFGSPPRVPGDATWVQSAWYLVRRKEAVGETDWLESMNMFVRREAFLSCGGFDEALVTCEDYDLSLRIKEAGLLVNDSRIVATHYGEAATLGHFFRKERWRGKSNFSGFFRHGLVLKELPSLLAPTLHCLLAAALLAVPVLLVCEMRFYPYLLLPVLLWQCMLLFKSFHKQRSSPTLSGVVQLFLLLNVYLFARGVSTLREK